jgi:hypothetical protein
MPIFAVMVQFSIVAKAPIEVAADTPEIARSYLNEIVDHTQNDRESYAEFRMQLFDRADLKLAKATEIDLVDVEELEEGDAESIKPALIIRRSDIT